ncbi:MAG TPA: PEGA domain-containing protein [Vicinamibacterales bacterium]|nr:PEGA domain-containing protein [Vicinamibacterales bacterium]
MRTYGFVASVVLAALVTAAPLANAQGRQRGSDGNGRQRVPSQAQSGGGGGERQRTERQAQPRAERAEPQRQPRAERAEPQRQPRTERENARAEAGRREVAPPQDRRPPQAFAQRNDGNRRDDHRNDGRYAVDRYAVPRTGPVPYYRDGDRRVYVQPYRNYYVYRYPAYRYYGGRRYYSYRYYDPYYSGDFYWSNYAWQPRSYYVGPSWDYGLGKLRLDIEQRDADVYIDGYFAGQVDDFDGVLQGLRLQPGNYSVEIVLPGFAPLQFDVQITPGRTTTYRGSLYPEP